MSRPPKKRLQRKIQKKISMPEKHVKYECSNCGASRLFSTACKTSARVILDSNGYLVRIQDQNLASSISFIEDHRSWTCCECGNVGAKKITNEEKVDGKN